MFYIILSLLLYYEPDILGNTDNQIIANPLITPINILPEWYYLLFYSCLRSFPNKYIGVIIVLNLLVVINIKLKTNDKGELSVKSWKMLVSFYYSRICYIESLNLS